jgi:hypothetical protein
MTHQSAIDVITTVRETPFREDNVVVIHSQVSTDYRPRPAERRGLIRRRPMLSFFVLANLLS